MSKTMISRRRALALLAGGAACLGGTSARAVMPLEACARVDAGDGGLRGVACRHKVSFGAAVSTDDLRVPAYAELVARECSLLVPNWEMKWGAVQKQQGRFDFSAVDAIVGFARAHGMAMRGHTIVWHGNMPDWLPAQLGSRNWYDLMAQQIGAVVGRYHEVVSSWDIVNEAIEPEDGRADGLRDSVWLRAAGPGYVAEAYKLAAHFAPEAKMVYNEYGIEHQAEWTRKRRLAVLHLLERLKKADAPVHALGLQSHLRVGDDFDAAALSAFLAEVRGLGVAPQVTEFDVRADRVSSAAGKDRKTADLARAYLDTLLAAGCDTVVCWGLSDDKNWRGDQEPDDRPLPFDRHLAKKPLYDAIQASLAGSLL